MGYTAFIGLGSNLDSPVGAPPETIRAAIHALGEVGKVTVVSSLYRTEPVGFREQPDFINAVARLETSLEPEPLLHALFAIERRFGRERSHGAPKGPRTLDLDLLLVFAPDGTAMTSHAPGLTLPHPEMARRRFVLQPLVEIAPELPHPLLQETVSELLRELLRQNGGAAEEAIKLQD